MSETVLITGGTGSFGQAFVQHLLRQDAGKVIVFSRDELKQSEMARRIVDPRIRFFIGDVRDLERLKLAFRDVDIVVHAAAMKQIPACEYNPEEAIKTNVDGARNVIKAALDTHVERVVALSSDKAVAACNTYGKTKALAENLFIQANVYRGLREFPLFSVVRYGNVVGSRGSVIPLFKEQAKTGKLTVTDGRMTRFWMTMDRAVDLVLYALNTMHGGEIFIPRGLPSMSVVALARRIAPAARIEYIGIRPGEKLHEVLMSSEEIRGAYESFSAVMIPPVGWSVKGHWKPLDSEYTYCSATSRCPSAAEVDEWLK